jgi:hypothetical protein
MSTSEKISDIQNASAIAFMFYIIARPMPEINAIKLPINQRDSKTAY